MVRWLKTSSQYVPFNRDFLLLEMKARNRCSGVKKLLLTTAANLSLVMLTANDSSDRLEVSVCPRRFSVLHVVRFQIVLFHLVHPIGGRC